MLRNRPLAKLKENIRKCEEYKVKIAKAVGMLKLQYVAGRITKEEHDKNLSKILEGKSTDYWNDYYDGLISGYNSKISSVRKKYSYSIFTALLLAASLVVLMNLGQFTGEAVYNGASQQGYIDRGGACNYGTAGLIIDTSTDDSVYFSQGPFNGAYSTTFDWQTGRDIIYIDLGPVAEARSDMQSITIIWNGRFSKTTGTGKPPTDVGIAWYNWVDGSWTQYDQGIVSQAEKTSTITITDPLLIQAMVSAETSGYVRIGFQAMGTTTQCNSLVLTDLSSSAIVIQAKPTTTSTSTSSTSTSTTTSTSTSSSTTVSTSTSTTSLSTSTSTTSTVLPSQPGQVLVTVAASIGISVDSVYSTSNFATLAINTIDDTLDNNPAPILIRNEGSVLVDMQLSATSLWSGTSAVPTDYKFSIDVPDPLVFTSTGTGQPADSCSPLQCFNAAGTILSPTNMPISPALPANAINNLDFSDTNDEAEINIYIHVPNDEPAGSKASTLTITGVDASTF